MSNQKIGILVTVLGVALSSVGRTVALWPVNYDDEIRQANDLRCRIDPANDLTLSQGKICPGTPWTYPPNPDTTLPTDFTKNAYAVSNDTALAKKPVLTSSVAGRYCVRTNDFTVEGWIRLLSTPTSSGWYYVLGAMESSSYDHRWFLSLRMNNSRLAWYFATPQKGDSIKYLSDIGEDEISTTNGWRHIAVSHDADNGAGKEVWKVYLDGTRILYVEQAIPTFAGNPTNGRFDLGGRTSGNNSTPALFDYWRISDTVLTPDQFLNHGGDGTVDADGSTVAYWKLDRQSDGTINPVSSVGGWEMNGLFRKTSSFVKTSHGMDMESAFAGMPPNMSMSPAPTLQLANSGSLRPFARTACECLVTTNIGCYLTLTNNFTLEGWFKPLRETRYGLTDIQFLALTRQNPGAPNNSGWQFGYKYAGGVWRLFIYTEDDQGCCLPDAFLSEAIPDWYMWRHVALVYSAEEGNGTWRCYLDGEKVGEVQNKVRPSKTGVYGTSLSLGSRPGNNDREFQGKIDYVRVSGTTLQLSQFLRAENGSAATDVLALWPLNTSDGAYFDGRDCMGMYDLTVDVASNLRAQPFADAPVITNPDMTPSFAGDAATVNGSVRFYDSTATLKGDRASMGTFDPATLDLINTATNMTVECYVCRNGTSGTSWEHVFAAYQTLTPTSNGDWFGLAYKAGTGFYVVDKLWGSADDQAFSETGGLADDGTWHHLALTRTFGQDTVDYEFFFDGQSKGVITRSVDRSKKGSCFVAGGRANSANSFRGAMSSLRFSNKILTPSEFLNATGTRSSHEALAFWPLDYVGGALNVGSLTNSFFGFQSVAGAAGTAEQAYPYVLAGTTRMENQGAVTLAGGGLSARNCGAWMAPAQSGTVEGWFKWGGADGVVVGAMYGTSGWTLSCNAGALVLYGKGNTWNTPYISGTILDDFSGYEGKWVHLALVYDNGGGRGIWSLYLDNVLVGSLENLWMPPGDVNGHLPDFQLGGTMTGVFDLWRVSRGALSPEELLANPPSGLSIIFR